MLVITDEIMKLQGKVFTDRLQERGHAVTKVRANELNIELQKDRPTIWWRGQQLHPHGAVIAAEEYGRDTPVLLESLRTAGAATLNSPEGTQISADKFITHLKLAKAGIPMPRTTLVKSRSNALDVAQNYGYPVVFKALHGESGNGVTRAFSKEDAQVKLAELIPERSLALVQEYLECGGLDKRLLVLDGKVIAAMGRSAPAHTNEFRTNSRLGGQSFRVDVTPQEESIAIAAAKQSGLRWTGVDMATVTKKSGSFNEGDVVLFEINSVPGIVSTAEITGVDIMGALLDALEKTILTT